jgi:hypothetical protein
MRLYRANFGDGTTSKGYPDRRDALRAKWGRAGIVQYRTSIEAHDGGPLAEGWVVIEPSRASRNGPPIVEIRGVEG